MTDASVGGLVARWRKQADEREQQMRESADVGHRPGVDIGRAKMLAFRDCADELSAALPDLLYAAGEHASIQALLSDANIEGLTVYQQVETLLAALTAGGWQPIETAPKDEKDMLMMEPEMGVIIGRWFNNGRKSRFWLNDHGVECHPTHWMPLPSAPRAQGESQ